MRYVLLWLVLGGLEALFRFVAVHFGADKLFPSPLFGAVVALSYTASYAGAFVFIALFTLARDLCFTQYVGLSTVGYSLLLLFATRTQNAMNLAHPLLLAVFAFLYEVIARLALCWLFDATFSFSDTIIAAVISAVVSPIIFVITLKLMPPPKDKYRIPTDAYFMRR